MPCAAELLLHPQLSEGSTVAGGCGPVEMKCLTLKLSGAGLTTEGTTGNKFSGFSLADSEGSLPPSTPAGLSGSWLAVGA